MADILEQGKVDKEIANGIATVTFFHPLSNSLPGKLLNELANTITELGTNNSVNVIVLKSAGERAFCAGASFDELIDINDLETGKIVGQLKSNPLTGKFVLPLPKGKQYAYFMTKKNHFSVARSVDLSTAVNANNRIQIASFEALKAKKQALTLYNIFFEGNSTTLQKTSFSELDRLAKQIIEYKLFITLIMESNQGDKSEEKVNAVKNYLISKGCKERHIMTSTINTQQPYDNPNEKRDLIKLQIDDYKEVK